MDLICRTCLIYEDDMEPIFNEQRLDNENLEICKMILLCTGLEISANDKYSNTICTSCLESLTNAYKYRKKCWEAQKVFQETSRVLDSVPNDDKTFITFGSDHYEIDTFEDLEMPVYCSTNQSGKVKHDFSVNVTTHSQTPLKAVISKKLKNVELNKSPSPQIDELIVATPTNHKRYKNMDKYIKTINTPLSSTEMQLYLCSLCNQTYISIGPLRKHLLLMHNIRIMRTFQCEICSKTFVNEKYFNQHVDGHNQSESVDVKHICQICGKHYKFESTLLDHIRRHNGEKPFSCRFCIFRTTSSYELKVHMCTHTGERPYICHICGAAYKSSSHRGTHIKEAHTKGRPYECLICSKNYKSYRVYTQHMQMHNSKNVIKCEICQRKFNYRKNLMMHMKQHGEKTHKCTVCKKAFYQKQNCQKHMRKIHKI